MAYTLPKYNINDAFWAAGIEPPPGNAKFSDFTDEQKAAFHTWSDGVEKEMDANIERIRKRTWFF